MSTSAHNFVAAIPCTEDEFEAVARAMEDKKHLDQTVELLTQLADYLEARRDVLFKGRMK